MGGKGEEGLGAMKTAVRLEVVAVAVTGEEGAEDTPGTKVDLMILRCVSDPLFQLPFHSKTRSHCCRCVSAFQRREDSGRCCFRQIRRSPVVHQTCWDPPGGNKIKLYISHDLRKGLIPEQPRNFVDSR